MKRLLHLRRACAARPPAPRRRQSGAVAHGRARLPARPVARLHLPGRLAGVAVRAERRDLRRAQQRRLVRLRLFPRHRRVRRRRPQGQRVTRDRIVTATAGRCDRLIADRAGRAISLASTPADRVGRSLAPSPSAIASASPIHSRSNPCPSSKPASSTSRSNIPGRSNSGSASSRSTGCRRKCRWARIAATGRRSSTDHERNLLTQIFRFFTQADVEVQDCYHDKYGRVFKPTEIKMMLTAFSNMETVHIAAYSHLLDTIGMPESEYGMFLQYKEMKDKHDYLAHLRRRHRRGHRPHARHVRRLHRGAAAVRQLRDADELPALQQDEGHGPDRQLVGPRREPALRRHHQAVPRLRARNATA